VEARARSALSAFRSQPVSLAAALLTPPALVVTPPALAAAPLVIEPPALVLVTLLAVARLAPVAVVELVPPTAAVVPDVSAPLAEPLLFEPLLGLAVVPGTSGDRSSVGEPQPDIRSSKHGTRVQLKEVCSLCTQSSIPAAGEARQMVKIAR